MNSSGRPLLSVGGGSRENMRTPSSIRIRRLPSSNSVSRPLSGGSDTHMPEERDFADPGTVGRRRSTSAPQRPVFHEPAQNDLTRQHTAEPFMPSIVEGQATAAQEARGLQPVQSRPDDVPRPFSNLQRTATDTSEGAQAMSTGNAARGGRGLRRLRSGVLPPRQQELSADSEYDADVVSMLDLIGTYYRTLRHVYTLLTRTRSRGTDPGYSYEHAKLPFRARFRPPGEPSANLRLVEACWHQCWLRYQRRRRHSPRTSKASWHTRVF
jgi:hypothetical protein